MGPSRAVLVASTEHQLMMVAALLRRLPDLRPAVVLWIGGRELAEVRPLLDDDPGVGAADFHGHARLKLWRGDEQPRLQRVRTRLAAELPAGDGPALFLGNDNLLFPQVVMEHLGIGWDAVTLYEEGIGLYAGSSRMGEKAAVNLLLRLRGHPYREFYRDFSRNPRIRRIACNHPSLLERSDVEIVDLAAAYRQVLLDRAAVREEEDREPIEALVVSSSLSEAGLLPLERELELLAEIREAVQRRLGVDRVHIRFHPYDRPAKRAAAVGLGYDPLPGAGPFELEYLRRPIRHLISIRSSVMLNLSLLGGTDDRRLWLVRSDEGPYRRFYRPAVARIFDRVVAEHRHADYLDPRRSAA